VAVRVLVLVMATFAVLYGCGQASSPVEKQEKRGDVEQAARGYGEKVGGKGDGDPSAEELDLSPPEDKTLWLTVPKMDQIENDEIPTGSTTDETLFHDFAGVHSENTGYRGRRRPTST
jgi:hypothetical protein